MPSTFSPFLNPFLKQPSPTYDRGFVLNPEEDDDPFKRPQGAYNSDTDFMSAYKELLTKQNGPATAAYRKFLEQGYPNEKDYQPSKVTRLGAILSGAATGFRNPAAAPEVARSIIDEPFNKAVRRYGMEGSRLKEGAALEESTYGRQIAAARDLRQLENQRIDNERQDMLARDMIKNRADNLELARQRAYAAGLQWVTDKNTGISGFIDKYTHNFVPIGKFDRSTGERIDSEKEMKRYESNLAFGRASTLQDRSFKQQKEMEDIRQEHRSTLIGERGDKQIQIIQERAKLKGGQTTSQQIKENYQRAQALADSNPERYSNVWKINPMTGYFDLNQEAAGTPPYKEIYDRLYNGFSPDTTPSGNTIIRNK